MNLNRHREKKLHTNSKPVFIYINLNYITIDRQQECCSNYILENSLYLDTKMFYAIIIITFFSLCSVVFFCVCVYVSVCLLSSLFLFVCNDIIIAFWVRCSN